jgi:hypothetical protein
MPLPNFFIAGAPKAGTDRLYYQLDRHPEIYMSPLKEPCYFSTEIRPGNFHRSLRAQVEASATSLREYLDAGAPNKRFGGIVCKMEDYQRLFAKAANEKAIGEGSVCYLWSRTAAAGIADVIPHARIILVLMDPAERAFHQYLKSLSDGTVSHSFRRHLQLAMKNANGDGGKIRPFHPFLAFGNYTEQIRRYLQHFPACQLHISLYEDAQGNYGEWFADLLSFLGVESGFAPPDVEVPSEPHVPRFLGLRRVLPAQKLKRLAGETVLARLKPLLGGLQHNPRQLPKLLPEDRALLVAYYHDDILRLEELIQRDLAAWLR